jgi:transposase
MADRPLMADQTVLSGLYHAGLRGELTRRLGVGWEVPVNGIAEMTGLDREVLKGFSRRSSQVEARREEKSPGRPTTRRYTDGEKAAAVRLVRQLHKELGSEHGTVQRVADQLGYGVESVPTWVRDADARDGLAGPDVQRVRELEAENTAPAQELRETRRANETLKKAAA